VDREPKGHGTFESVGVYGRIILKYALKIRGVSLWTGLIWLMADFMNTVINPSVSVNFLTN
jgi:hypothetical protein